MTKEEKVKIGIYINDEEAQAKLEDLKKDLIKIRALRDKAAADGDVAGFTKLTNEVRRTEKQARQLEKTVIDVNAVLKNLDKVNLKDLYAAISKARVELGLIELNDKKAIAAKQEQIKILTAEYNKAKGVFNDQQGFFKRSSVFFNQYFAMISTFIASFTGLMIGFRRIADETAKMDDAYSDVMKTTGMTRDEVLALNEVFKKMDTRTAREELNKLAKEAGKLNLKSKKDVLGFVEGGNQIRVALGEDLGDDAILSIGKMVDVYKDATDQIQNLELKEQLLAVGSAVNELGASSSANEKYLVDFSGRLGGVSKQAKISIGDIMGFASSLDQDMQQVETSATAFQQFIMKLMGEPAKFAKLAGLEVKKFTDLVSTDTNKAIKQFLGAMNEKGGFQQLIPIFDEIGLDGSRAVGVLSSLAGSINKVDEAQKIANVALKEGTSITKEYEIKNNNLAAQREKARKAFLDEAIALGEKLSPAMIVSTNLFTYFIKLIGSLIKIIPEYSNYLVIAAAYVAAYNATLIKKNGLFVINNLLMKEGIGLKIKDAVVLQALIAKEQLAVIWKGNGTVATKLAATAQWAWNAAVAANPIGALVTAMVALYGAIKAYDKYNAETIRLEKEKKAAIDKTIEVTDNLTTLYDNQRIAISKLSKFSEAQKLALYQQTEATIKQAEAELLLLSATQKRIAVDAARPTLWQKTLNTIQGLFNYNLTELYNKRDSILNGIAGGESMDEAIKELNAKIKLLKEQRQELYSLINPDSKSDSSSIDQVTDSLIDQTSAYTSLTNQISKIESAIRDFVAANKPVPNSLIHQLAQKKNDLAEVEKTLKSIGTEIGTMTTIKGFLPTDEQGLKTRGDSTPDDVKGGKGKLETWMDDNEAYVQAGLDVSNSIFEIIAQRNATEIDMQLEKLDAMREAELSNKNLTEAQKEAINEKYRQRELQLKKEAFEKEKATAVAQSIINTAVAVAEALPNVPLAIAAGVAGAAQTAIILAQKPPYKAGGYTDEDPSDDRAVGIVHANEFVANAQAKRNPTVRPYLDVINKAQQAGTIRSLNLPAVMAAEKTAMARASGYSQPAGYHFAEANEMALAVAEFKKVVQQLQDKGIEATLVYQTFKRMADKEKRAINKTS